MQQQQPLNPDPVTYGDVFPSLHGDLSSQPITPEDAALMQSAETLARGSTQKRGAASAMQAAADKNLKLGSVPKDAHSPVADAGVCVVETILPGEIVHTEIVAGQPVVSSAEPTPMVPVVAAAQDAVTIGEALEAAAMSAGDRPIDPSDAQAIQSAEKRATGVPLTVPGGLSATAQAAAVLNPRVEHDYSKTTLADVLMDASSRLPADKTVTREDAEKVAQAERRNKEADEVRPDGVAATMLSAAEVNEKVGMAADPLTTQMQRLNVEQT